MNTERAERFLDEYSEKVGWTFSKESDSFTDMVKCLEGYADFIDKENAKSEFVKVDLNEVKDTLIRRFEKYLESPVYKDDKYKGVDKVNYFKQQIDELTRVSINRLVDILDSRFKQTSDLWQQVVIKNSAINNNPEQVANNVVKEYNKQFTHK